MRGTKVISQTHAHSRQYCKYLPPGGRYLQRKMTGWQVKLHLASGPVLETLTTFTLTSDREWIDYNWFYLTVGGRSGWA